MITLVLIKVVKCQTGSTVQQQHKLLREGHLNLCVPTPSAMPRFIYFCDFQRTESYSKMCKTHYVHILTPTKVLFLRNDSLPSLLHSAVNNAAGILRMLTRN